jgi:hypothetical protein
MAAAGKGPAIGRKSRRRQGVERRAGSCSESLVASGRDPDLHAARHDPLHHHRRRSASRKGPGPIRRTDDSPLASVGCGGEPPAIPPPRGRALGRHAPPRRRRTKGGGQILRHCPDPSVGRGGERLPALLPGALRRVRDEPPPRRRTTDEGRSAATETSSAVRAERTVRTAGIVASKGTPAPS